MSRFIDTHCHFDFPVFYHDLENSLALAQQAQVKNYYSCGCSVELGRGNGIVSL